MITFIYLLLLQNFVDTDSLQIPSTANILLLVILFHALLIDIGIIKKLLN